MSKPARVSERVEITVPMVPPSVNHYKVRYRNGRTVVSDEAHTFKAELALAVKESARQYAVGKHFSVKMDIVLAAKQKGDVDNFPKLVLDGLAAANVFRNPNGLPVSDAHVCYMTVFVDREGRPAKGYTDITVEALK